MSQEQNDLNLIEQIKQQHAQFINQRDQAQANLNQLIGALYACELMINKLDFEHHKDIPEDKANAQVNDQESQSATQE